jgi:hypothetical protein
MKHISPITALVAVALAGCQASGGNAVAGLGGVPEMAVTACSSRADEFWNAAPGTSVVNGAQPATGTVAGNWQLQMGTGSYRSTCMVNPIGRVISIVPG